MKHVKSPVAFAIMVICMLVSRHALHGQGYDGYVQEIKRPASQDFSAKDLEHIFETYRPMIMPDNDVSRLMNSLDGNTVQRFPLEKLKQEEFYHKQMEAFLDSKNRFLRIFACMTIASANDTSFNDTLRKLMKDDSDKGITMEAGIALLYLGDNHTSELFDFLVANEDFDDAHMLPLYMKLDKHALEQTAYEKITSNNSKARILAVEILSETGLNPKTEEVVKAAVKSWDMSIKGYAIYTMSALRMGHLKALLAPLLKEKSIRDISLQALANSPTPEDQDCVKSLVPHSGPVPEEALNALYASQNEAMVRDWLVIVRDKAIPEDYVFFVFQQPLLAADAQLDLLRETIRKTKNQKIRNELPRALKGRTDEESVGLLIDLLSDPDETTRYWAASTLSGVSSKKLADKIPALIKDPKLRTTALTKLAIENRIDNLGDIYRDILKSDPGQDSQRSATEYLSAFPSKDDAAKFRATLQNGQDPFLKRMATRGLGLLKDKDAVDLIIAAMNAEPKDDLNARTYLVALGQIKGDTARRTIESFKASNEEQVRLLVAALLKDWDSPSGADSMPDYTGTPIVNNHAAPVTTEPPAKETK